ncbi:MAG: hypothetical protein R3266_03505 [Gemmatimonadota bacterium]|nr:hypothetical protein [Gemmatimonadota bacterium]
MVTLRARASTCALATLLLAAFAGCEEPPTGPAGDRIADQAFVATSHGAPGETLPLQMTGTGFLQGQDFAPGFGPPAFGKDDFGGRCSTPADFVIRFSLEGQMTHLGGYTADLEHCTIIDWTTGFIGVLDGVATITAGDGDELWARYERALGPPGTLEHYRFVGGTGRFADADGEGWAAVQCDQAAGTCDFDLEGWIIYDASDRSAD